MKATTVGILSLVLFFGTTNSVEAQAVVSLISETVLRDACQGGDPLPDATTIGVMWDANLNGPDSTDVIAAEFLMNGLETIGISGTFVTDPGVYVPEDFPVPWTYYVRIDVCWNNVRWTSEIFNVQAGLNSFVLEEWNCTPCEAAGETMFLQMCDVEHVLTDACDGGEPLPDSTLVYIYWDENANGPDDADMLLPLASEDISANYNQFIINGELSGIPGTFCVDPSFEVETTVVPLRIFLYIPYCVENIKWTSDVVVMHPDSVFSGFEWACDVCETVSTNEQILGVPNGFALHPNYPNPFNPTTEISFDLPRAMQTNLKIFDVLGREVAVLTDGVLNAGAHSVVFDANALSSGVYFYRLEAGSFVETRKMVLMK